MLKENQFKFHKEERKWVEVYVNLIKYKESKIIYTTYFSHIYCDLLYDWCNVLKMPYLFTFIPNESLVDNDLFMQSNTPTIKNKELLKKQSAYLQHIVKTFENSNYDIFSPASVHAIFDYDEINTIIVVVNTMIEFLIKSSKDGITRELKNFIENTKRAIQIRKDLSLTNEIEFEKVSEVKKNKFERVSNHQSDNDLLTIDETMKFLSVSKPTLYKWKKEGKLKSYGIGKRVYYKKSEIEDSLSKLK